MDYYTFLERIINDGIEGARQDYSKPEDKLKLDGSIKGFEECRDKDLKGLCELLDLARTKVAGAFTDDAKDYWYWRCREAEIEWVCNVMSATLVNSGMTAIIPPTCRGAMKAHEILRSEGTLVVHD